MKRIKKGLAERTHTLVNNRKIMRTGKQAQEYLYQQNLIDDEDIDQLICVSEFANNNEVVNDNEDEIVFGMAYPWLPKYRPAHYHAPGIKNDLGRPEDGPRLLNGLDICFANVPRRHMIDILLARQQYVDIQGTDIFQNDNETVVGVDVARNTYFPMNHIPHADIYPNQIFQYNNNPLLERSVYYLLLIDENGQMLVIKNRSGYWTTVKAHRRIKNDRSLETPKECLSREFDRLIQVKNLITDEIYDHFDMDQYIVSGQYQYVEVASSGYQGDNVCIDLFICRFTANSLAFCLRNADAFQEIGLNSIFYMPENTIGTERDIYRALPYLLC